MKFEIKNRWSGELIFSIETDNWRLAIEAAIKAEANLSEANLSKANLSWSNLSEADLSKADLRPIKHDVWGVLLYARAEVPFLRAALAEGRVDGSVYRGECACLCGTLAKAKGLDTGEELPFANPSSLAERFFLAIRKGDTPDKSPAAKLALEWVDEFLALTA